MLFWLVSGAPAWVVAFDDWLGKTCQLHVATNRPRIVPRSFARSVFHYAFRVQKREMLFAMVNSQNLPALRLDRWLGFRDLITIPKMHDSGGDIVVLQMPLAECRWLGENNEQKHTAGA